MTMLRLHNGFPYQARVQQLDRMNQLMNGLLNEHAAHDQDFTPQVNMIEKHDSFVVQMALPGFSKEDIQIRVDNGLLIVSHEAESEASDDSRFIRREIRSGRFSRQFRLSKWVNAEKIEARMSNGILELEIAKKEEAVTKPVREISIS